MIIFETRNDMLDSFDKQLCIAELGVFEGEFSKEIYNRCNPKKLFLVDLFQGYFGSGDKDGKNHHYVQLEEEHKKLMSEYESDDSVEIIKSSTIDFLNSIENDSLDVVYIDADHDYLPVKNDLILSYQKVKTNGLICGHDYVPHTQAKRAVDDFCNENNLTINYLTKDGCPSFCIVKK